MKANLYSNTCRFLSISIIALLFAFSFSSCKKNTTVTVSSALNIINAGETSAPQDFFVDDAKANTTPIAYTQSTGYLSVSGSHTCSFRTSGTGTVNNTFPVAFAPGAYYSVYYADDKSALGIQDDKTTPQTGKARVRFINLSTIMTAKIDVYIAGGAAVVSGLAYENFSDYYEINSSTALTVNAAGSTTALVNIPGNIQAGKIYTIYVSGATALSYHVVPEN
ncbi:MAG: hypothetical protein JWR38_1779 [Mucilaginibacter sp.]|nr:hypothetical protein [Mucilaginibacter sp.]